MEKINYNIFGLIGYALMTYYHGQEEKITFEFVGYLIISLTFMFRLIDKESNKEFNESNEILEKIAHLTIALSHGFELTHDINWISLLGFIGNGLMISKYRSLASYILLFYYTILLVGGKGNIGLVFIIMYYYQIN